jgi:hypothetical protein
MSLLNLLIDEAKKRLSNNIGNLRIDNIILGKSLYTIKGSSKVFTDMNFCLVLFENAYGFSYFQGEIDYSLEKYVNKNAVDILNKPIPIYLKIAITDALFLLIDNDLLKNKEVFKGDIRQKATQRATKLLDHIPDGSNVLVLGAATEIIEEAKNKKCKIRILDLEEQKIGMEISAINVSDGSQCDIEEEIKNTDYIVATGMIFVSETADMIIEIVKSYSKHLTVYMETGSNFGPQLIKHGVNKVLSEFFPYYDFFGDTKYLVFTK